MGKLGDSSARRRAEPMVLCAACGSRFEAEGATTLDRVACPMCDEVVELAELHAERRRYRPVAPPVSFAGPREAKPAAAPRTSWQRRCRDALPYVVAGLVLGLAFSPWAEPVRRFVFDLAAERFRPAK